ncbi:hypothetical protein EDC01DRAFT_628107 [Geopyxis carbonaria]|nr:hypothetical protein EDC01DRAFT_628107 [Geopyxis carbonaria]
MTSTAIASVLHPHVSDSSQNSTNMKTVPIQLSQTATYSYLQNPNRYLADAMQRLNGFPIRTEAIVIELFVHAYSCFEADWEVYKPHERCRLTEAIQTWIERWDQWGQIPDIEGDDGTAVGEAAWHMCVIAWSKVRFAAKAAARKRARREKEEVRSPVPVLDTKL